MIIKSQEIALSNVSCLKLPTILMSHTIRLLSISSPCPWQQNLTIFYCPLKLLNQYHVLLKGIMKTENNLVVRSQKWRAIWLPGHQNRGRFGCRDYTM